jgi:hypothetical protein
VRCTDIDAAPAVQHDALTVTAEQQVSCVGAWRSSLALH